MKTIKQQFHLVLTLWLSITIFLSLNLSKAWSNEIRFLAPQDVSKHPEMVNTVPTIALDKEGNVHIAYLGTFVSPGAPDNVATDVFYTNNIGGDFIEPIQISVPTGFYSRDVSIATDGEGNAHVVFRRSTDQIYLLSDDDIYYVNNIGGEFKDPERIIDGELGGKFSGPRTPSIGVDDISTVHIIFDTNFEGLFYTEGTKGNFIEPISVPGPAPFGGEPPLVLDKEGNVHIAYFSIDGDIYYVNNVGGDFGTPVVVLDSQSSDYGPAMTVDDNGAVYIATRLTRPFPELSQLIYVTNKGGHFSNPIIVDGEFAFYPSICVDSTGGVHIAYKVSGDSQSIQYANNLSCKFVKMLSAFGQGFYYYMGLAGIPWFALDEEKRLLHFTFYYGDTVYYARGIFPELPEIDTTLPTAAFTISPLSGDTETVFTVDASISSDNAASTEDLEVRWDWEDDEIYDTEFSTTKIATHQYSLEGIKIIRLEVKDLCGNTNTTTKTVRIAPLNEPPVASFTVSPQKALVRQEITVDASGCSDAQDVPEILEVRWDWEDDGIYDTSFSTEKIATHWYEFDGFYTIRLEVKDSSGWTSSTTQQVAVSIFQDVTELAGINDDETGMAVACGDYDNDGWVDIYVVNDPYGSWSGKNILYRNNGDGTFTDVTDIAGVGDEGMGRSAVLGDYDNDGYLDLYVVNGKTFPSDPIPFNVLYRNNGDGTFTDVTQEAGVGDAGNGTAAAWGDYDGDGFIDLYVTNYDAFEDSPSKLYHNNGDGTFTDVTESSELLAIEAKVAMFVDYNNDGFIDIFNGLLMQNNGDETFSALDIPAMFHGLNVNLVHLIDVAWGDYNNDGWQDVYVAETFEHKLFRNNGDGTFTNVAREAGIDIYADLPKYVSFGDYDNDGFLDIYVVRHIEPNLLYRNNGDGTFSLMDYQLDYDDYGEGFSWLDYDNDGSLDVYLVNGFSAKDILYHNEGNNNHWLVVKTVGTLSNRYGIGAKVTVKTGGLTQSCEVRAGSSRSQDSLWVHFGLGQATQADVLEIRWPSGVVQTFHNISADQILTVTEPKQFVYGDVSQDGKVSAYDAALVLQATVGLITLTPEQEELADVSGNETVSAYDASLILQRVVGLIQKFPRENGDAAPVLATTIKNYEVTLTASNSNPTGTKVTVSISIDDAKGIFSGEFTLDYDSKSLKLIAVSATDLSKEASLVYHAANGQAKLSLARDKNFSGGGNLVNLEFEVLKDAPGKIMNPFTLSKVKLNEGTNVTVVNSLVEILPLRTCLLQNYPNPFNPDTWLPFQLAQDASVAISIYNANGQLIRNILLGRKEAGVYTTKDKAAHWDGRNSFGEKVASGVYYYTIQVGNFTATRKMVILK
jgi:PKD repeat protein